MLSRPRHARSSQPRARCVAAARRRASSATEAGGEVLVGPDQPGRAGLGVVALLEQAFRVGHVVADAHQPHGARAARRAARRRSRAG